jgi:hypothetical protein
MDIKKKEKREERIIDKEIKYIKKLEKKMKKRNGH